MGLSDPYVSPAQQGVFAALYRRLGIVPTWTDNAVTIPAGVTALMRVGASDLAIENDLVQLDGFTWAEAEMQADEAFPIRTTA